METCFDQLAEFGEIRFTVFGVAQPAGSKRGFVINGRAVLTDANPKSRTWKSEVKDAARAAYSGPPLNGPLGLAVEIYRPYLKAHLRKDGTVKPNAPKWCITKPDATKLLRGIEDAITDAGLWRDDAQVAMQTVTRSYGDPPRVEITISPLET